MRRRRDLLLSVLIALAVIGDGDVQGGMGNVPVRILATIN